MKKGTKVNVKSINKNGVVISSSNNRVSIMMEDGTAKVFDISDIEMFGKGGKAGDCIEYIKNSQPIKNNGYYLHIDNMNNYVASNSVNTPKINSLCLITFNSGGQDNLKAVDTINSMLLSSEIAKLLDIDIEIARIIVSEQITHSKPFTMSMLNDIENKNIIIADRDKIVCTNLSMKYAKGGEVKSEFKVEVNQYIPYGSSMGKNYYYVANSKGNTISKKTKKAYRGKQMNEYKFDTEKDAQKFANSMNKKYAKGGNADVENNEMVLNNNKQIAHHTKELPNAIKGKKVPAWVVAKVNRSASDLSDATHYMDGQGESYANGGVVEPYDEEKYSSEYDYLRKIITKNFGEKNRNFSSADWGGIDNWTIKGDMYEGIFIIIDDNAKVILMERKHNEELEENEDTDILEAEVNDTKGLQNLFSKAIQIKENKMAKGGGVNMHSKFDLNEKGNFSAKINNKDYEIIYRDDVSKLYDLFENGKKIKSSRSVRDLMQFPKQYANGGGVEEYNLDDDISNLYEKSGFINSDFNWKLKLLEMIQDQSIEAYNIYQKLSKEQKEDVLQELFEVDNDMGSDGDGDIETSKENLQILLEDAKNGKSYAKGGRLTSNEDIIEAFLTSNREAKVGNLSTHYNEYDNQMLLRNYGTLIASRKGNNVHITSIKYSVTTTKITNMVNRMAKDKGLNVKYVEKFEDGGMTSSYCYEIGGL